MTLVRDGGATTPCSVVVERRGLALRPVGERLDTAAPPVVFLAWRAIAGFDADGALRGPDGSLRQVLRVVGTESSSGWELHAPSATVGAILADVRRRAGSWKRAQAPSRLTRSVRVPVTFVRGATAPVLGCCRQVTRPAVQRGIMSLHAVATAFGRAARAARRWSAPVSDPVARWISRSLVWLALAAVVRRTLQLVAGPPGDQIDRPRLRRRPLVAGLVAALVATSAAAGTLLVVPTAGGSTQSEAPPTVPHSGGLSASSMADIARMLQDGKTSVALPAATAAPAPAPPSLADAAPLSPHEVFGFAPYWTLPESAGFDVQGLTTLAYFSIGVNPDGTLDESGPGWNGYQSQALVDLVTRAHAAGDRVVLTVNCFDQSALDRLTSTPAAQETLAAALVSAVSAKNLDGVNLDLEGTGSQDQAGLTTLVATVSSTLHAVDPHWQVSMDTYASSAGDPSGFYDIAALSPWVDAFFVMAYQLNMSAAPSTTSPLTSVMMSDETTVRQYSAAVAPAKVILGIPYYGYDWPTSDGTLAAQASGAAVPITYAQVVSAGNPVYWDAVTNTAWSSYQVGTQWHEDFFEDPSSLYLLATLAQSFHLGGVGIWALGMDGNDPAMLAALDGFAPPQRDTVEGPVTTTPSTAVTPSASSVPSSTPTSGSSSVAPAAAASSPSPSGTAATSGSGGATVPSTSAPPGTAAAGGATGTYRYWGTYEGQTVELTPVASSLVGPGTLVDPLSTLTGFGTTDPGTDSCLVLEPSLQVWRYGPASSNEDLVAANASSGDCTTAYFEFVDPGPPSTGASGSGSTTTTTTGGTTSTSSTTTTTTTGG